MKKIIFQINDKKYTTDRKETILDFSLRNNMEIPHLCKHPDLEIKGNCRVCLVEVEGKGMVTSCSTFIEPGMKVRLDTPKVKKARGVNLELIFAEHVEKCPTCLYREKCSLLDYAKKFDLKLTKFYDRKTEYPVWQFSDAIQFDSSKCIDCRNCVDVCKNMQTCDFYKVDEKGAETIVRPKGCPLENEPRSLDLLKNDDEAFDCSYCGQCVAHCPVGALSEVPHIEEVEDLLKNKKEEDVLVAQIAPSVRVSIGEEFNEEHGKIMTGQLATSIKELGFDYAFDVSFGADLTTMEEARELVHWLETGKQKPMFTSCCPSWVKFAEFYFPEFVDNITSTKSPQMIAATWIKIFLAHKLGKNPNNIKVISIMPCTAKKHEMNLPDQKVDFMEVFEEMGFGELVETIKKDNLPAKIKTVDFVLTTREYALLLKKHKVDLPKLKNGKFDDPIGKHSAAGVIYGSSGGVMESALRTADYMLRVKKEQGDFSKILNGEKVKVSKKYSRDLESRIEFKEVRGQKNIRIAEVKVAGMKLKIAVVNTLGKAREILEKIKSGEMELDYVEVMACPGGCIGGGGQPIPVNEEIRKKRSEAIYSIGNNLKIKTAHENVGVLDVYKNYLKGNEKLIESIWHTDYKAAKREGYKVINTKE
jgi:iron-only hydrogenase group A